MFQTSNNFTTIKCITSSYNYIILLCTDKDKDNFIGNSTELDSHHYTFSKIIHVKVVQSLPRYVAQQL